LTACGRERNTAKAEGQDLLGFGWQVFSFFSLPTPEVEVFLTAETAKRKTMKNDPRKASRVLLLGLGTVGFGVYQRLGAASEQFDVMGALVRDRGKYERSGVPAGLLRTRVDQVLKLHADLVVDALPGLEPARRLVEHFLSAGVHVVSAGKALIAEHGPHFAALAQRAGAALRYGAAVGGEVPMIETVERCAARGTITSIAGVLNGTCNFVLERCGEGLPLEDALAEARRAGFAEMDASDDLSGIDAARKIRILSRHAFGAEARVVELQPLDEAMAKRAREVLPHGLKLRQVARSAVCDGEVRARVGFEPMPQDSPFGRLQDEGNALQVLSRDGTLRVVTGRGAGRWPTTEAVMADLVEVRRTWIGGNGPLRGSTLPC
jgi:homoserine dehydrogenase